MACSQPPSPSPSPTTFDPGIGVPGTTWVLDDSVIDVPLHPSAGRPGSRAAEGEEPEAR